MGRNQTVSLGFCVVRREFITFLKQEDLLRKFIKENTGLNLSFIDKSTTFYDYKLLDIYILVLTVVLFRNMYNTLY